MIKFNPTVALTVTNQLIHNLKRRGIPRATVKFIQQLLSKRSTRLKFNDYTSDPIPVLNGIGQGDPLSMLLYIHYNTNLLEIPTNHENEDAKGYIDDIELIAIGEDFEETTNRLKHVMTGPNGGLAWSKGHNLKFEVSKSAIMHFTRKTI